MDDEEKVEERRHRDLWKTNNCQSCQSHSARSLATSAQAEGGKKGCSGSR